MKKKNIYIYADIILLEIINLLIIIKSEYTIFCRFWDTTCECHQIREEGIFPIVISTVRGPMMIIIIQKRQE